tara:strand:- start:35 stop:376 length:342 start_codon:yes stop_codon:yes gene_type:complete
MTHTNQKIQNFQPKCLKPNTDAVGRDIAVSATGFILPCCWLDRPDSEIDEKVATLFNDKLHIDNNDTIKDIVSSKPWQKFMRELIDKPEKSSPICLEMCTVSINRHRTKERRT